MVARFRILGGSIRDNCISMVARFGILGRSIRDNCISMVGWLVDHWLFGCLLFVCWLFCVCLDSCKVQNTVIANIKITDTPW